MLIAILPPIFRDFITNILILFGMVLLYEISRFRPKERGLVKNGIVGVATGLFGVLTMMFPFTFEAGLIFDARSVLYVISGYFFGPLVTLTGATIGMAYRLYVGGGGVYAGLATIVAASLFGLGWAKLEKRLPRQWPAFFKFYLMGAGVNFVALLCQLLIIPFSNALPAIRTIAIPFLVFYPLATVVVAISMENHKKRLFAAEAIARQQLLLQSAIDSASEIEVYALDTKYNYLSFNKYHADSMERYYAQRPVLGANFLDFVTVDTFRRRLHGEIELALKGTTHTTESEIEVRPGKYYETHYNPIIDEAGRIIGVGVFAQDVTQRTADRFEIIHLSYHDSLTGLKNRRFYQEEIDRLNALSACIVTFVLLDINGLKLMNDAFGHHVGDELLKTVTVTIEARLPDNSSFMRIGGDEFLIIFYEMHEAEATSIIDTTDQSLREKSINGIPISVSFGVQEHRDGETIVDSIRSAEKRMYAKKLGEVTSSRHETIRAILNTLHLKSPREEGHSRRVALIAAKIGSELHLRREEVEMLRLMATLHDIGKIAIADAILDKPGRLTEAEWFEIQKHPETGYHILLAAPEYAEIAEDILSHHERWDGSGYPRKLKGEEIPFRARIIALADSYDAMTSDRPYRPGLGLDAAKDEIRRFAGSQFDPALAAVFVKMLESGQTDF